MSRALPVLFSLFVHGSIVASGFLLSDCGEPPEEKIYRVSLAEFTPAQASCAPVLQENPGPPGAVGSARGGADTGNDCRTAPASSKTGPGRSAPADAGEAPETDPFQAAQATAGTA